MSSPAEFLKSLPYFDSLGSQEIEPVLKEARELTFARGEIIFLEGEDCQGLYVVKSGQVRIFKSSPEGREQVLLIAQAGDSFNEVPVFDEGPNPASASALEPAVVFLIPKKVLLSLLASCPAAQNIIKLFARRLRHLTTMVEGLSFKSVVSRLAQLLLNMAVQEDTATPVPRLTQDEMAAMIGTVRDVIGRSLRHLERRGAIKLDGHRILVVSPDKLRDLI